MCDDDFSKKAGTLFGKSRGLLGIQTNELSNNALFADLQIITIRDRMRDIVNKLRFAICQFS